MAEKIFLEIDAKTAQAAKNLTKFGRTATKTMEGVQKSLNGVKLLAGGVVGFLAGRQIIRGLEKITQAASVQEDAINELNTALRLSGKFSEDASKGLQDFASELQKSSTFGDEAILSNAALIQSLGNLETEGLKRATKAAADLSAALGIDLRSASTLVGKAAAGEVGSFSRYGLVIKKAEDNATTFANALDALEKKFSGSALSRINTYSGAISQLENTQGDLLESLGQIITENPVVTQGIQKLTKFFEKLIEVVDNNKDAITELISKGFKALVSSSPAVFTFFQGMVVGWQAIKDAIDETLLITQNFVTNFARLAEIVSFNPLEAIQEKLTGEELPNKARDFRREMELLYDTIKEGKGGDTERLEKIFKILEDGKTAAKEFADAVDKIPDKVATVNFKTQFNGTDKAVAEVKKDLEGLINLNFGVEGPAGPDGIGPNMKAVGPTPEGPAEATYYEKAGGYVADSFANATKDMKVGEMIGKGFQMVLSGKQGAVQAVSAIGDALLPGIGGAITQLTNLGPEGAKAMIKEFATSLPEVVVTFVEALAASADVIIESLIDSLLINGGLERIVVSLISAIPRVAYKLVESTIRGLNNGLVAISDRFGLNMTSSFREPAWVQGLRDFAAGLTKIPEWMTKFKFTEPQWMKKLDELFNWLPEAIRKAIGLDKDGKFKIGGTTGQATEGVKGAVVGAYNKIGEETGFWSRGGVVYASNGYVPRGTDTVPAMLTPGERVLSVAQNQAFEAVPVLLAQILQVLGQPMSTSTSVEIDGNKLADVILQLNRRNARVAA